MNKKLAFVLYISLAAVSAALLLMTVLASAGLSSVWKGMPVLAVLAVFAVAISVSVVMFNPKKNFYSVGFYLLHIGIVLFLSGCLVFTVSGAKTNVAPPCVSSITPTVEYKMIQQGITRAQISNLKGYYNQVESEDKRELIDLGFNFRIIDFKTEYYDKEQTEVKHYEATLEFLNSDGSVDKVPLTVNKPVYRGDWKIYLMDVGENIPYGFTEVQILLKNDSAEPLSNAGIIITLIGTFVMCFMRRSGASEDKKAHSKLKRKAGTK